MTAEQIFKRRTGANNEDAEFYIELADARIRAYLALTTEDDISPYMMQEADIAVLYYQRDTGERNTIASLGYKSESFTEGQMSESHTLGEGATSSAEYEDAILAILQSLNQDEHTVGTAVMY